MTASLPADPHSHHQAAATTGTEPLGGLYAAVKTTYDTLPRAEPRRRVSSVAASPKPATQPIGEAGIDEDEARFIADAYERALTEQPRQRGHFVARAPEPAVVIQLPTAPAAMPAPLAPVAPPLDLAPLDARFEEIARLISETRNDHGNSEGASLVLARLDDLEHKFLAFVQRGSSTAMAEEVSAQMDELRGQVDRVMSELQRLEVIESEVARLIDGVNAAAAAHDGSSAPANGERLDAIQQLLTSYVEERRRDDGTTWGMIEAVHTLVHGLADRLQQLEQALMAPMPGYEEVPAETHAAEPAADASEAAADPAAATDHEPQPQPPRRVPQPEPSLAEPVAAERPTANRDALIASARRAAATAAAQNAAQEAEAAKARPARRPTLGFRRSWLSFEGPAPRPVLIAAVVFLAVAGAGLLYKRLTQKTAGPTIKIEQTTKQQATPPVGSEAAAPQKQSEAEIPDILADSPVVGEPRKPEGPVAPSLNADTSESSEIDVLTNPSVGIGEIIPEDTSSLTAVPANEGTSTISATTASASGADAPALPPATVAPLSLRLKAVEGDAVAQFEIASRYQKGVGGEPDYKEAAAWFSRAAGQGHALAQYHLAALYERGKGLARDPARARIWYTRSAEQGNVKAMHNLGVLFSSGSATPDYESAATWFAKAAEHGLADSQFNLAVLRESGLGVERDSAEAYRWYALAARGGDKEAAKRRDNVKSKLGPSVVKKLDREIKAWKPAKAVPQANDPRAVSLAPAATKPVPVSAAVADAAPDVAEVQTLLDRLGYRVAATGELDEATSEAIRRFEERSGMEPTGIVSTELVRRLSELAG
jgi:localization factor PodJL